MLLTIAYYNDIVFILSSPEIGLRFQTHKLNQITNENNTTQMFCQHTNNWVVYSDVHRYQAINLNSISSLNELRTIKPQTNRLLTYKEQLV